MKKKIAVMLLVTVMTASVFTGCGNSVEGDGKVQAAMANAGNSQEDSEGKAEGTEAGEPAPEATAEPTMEAAPEATAEPTPETTAEPTEEPASTEEPEKGMESGTAADSSQGTGNNGTAVSANDTAASLVPDWFDPVFYAATYPDVAAVMGTDADVLYQHYLNYGKAEGRSPSADSNTPSTTASNYLSQAFVNYLNEQRSAQGLSQITWNSGLESLALTRAQQISENFSHPTVMEATETILATDSSDVSSWYTTWYNSEGHRLVLQDKYMTDGACAVYQVGNYYYVAFVCNVDHNWDYLQEQFDAGNMEEYTWTSSDGKEITGYYSSGGDIIRDGNEEDLERDKQRAEDAGEEWVDPTTFDWGSGQ